LAGGVAHFFVAAPLNRRQVKSTLGIGVLWYFLSSPLRAERSRAETEMPLDFRPQFDKILELLLYLAHKRPGASKYQAVKFFYLADREHFARYGRPISFDNYFALWYGPVASNAMDLLEGDEYTFSQAGIDALPFDTETVPDHKGKPITYIREPRREVDFDILSESDIEVFDEIVEKYRDYTFEQLMKETHNHRAYQKAWHRRGPAKRSLMSYDEMIDDDARRAQLVEDLGPVAAHMK
jgi:uncharacterized phage-associated protein